MDKQELVRSETQVKTIESAAVSTARLSDEQRRHEHATTPAAAVVNASTSAAMDEAANVNAGAGTDAVDRMRPPTGNAHWKNLYSSIAKYAQELKASR